MYFPIPDTCFFINLIIKNGRYHDAAKKIHDCILGKRETYSSIVLLHSVKEEYFEALLKFNTVLGRIIERERSKNETIKVMKIFTDPEHNNARFMYQDMFNLLYNWIKHEQSRQETFQPVSLEMLLDIASKMKTALGNEFTNRFLGRKAIHYRPPDQDLERARGLLNLQFFPKEDRNHILFAFCYAQYKHRQHIPHHYLFITMDQQLGRRGSNYAGNLGRLAILLYTRFMDMNEIPTDPETSFVGQ